MKKIFVNPRNYTNFIYDAFIDRSGNGIARPQGEILYEVGQVVYVISENSIGVVLGVIGVTSEELRTDIDGMKCFSDVRPVTLEDFNIKGVRFVPRLLEEIQNTEKLNNSEKTE